MYLRLLVVILFVLKGGEIFLFVRDDRLYITQKNITIDLLYAHK